MCISVSQLVKNIGVAVFAVNAAFAVCWHSTLAFDIETSKLSKLLLFANDAKLYKEVQSS